MPLPWIRLDTSFFQNPKILQLLLANQHRAVTTHMAAMCWSGQQGMDGHVPEYILPMLNGRPAEAKKLVSAELWITEPGGWAVNGWDEYQLSDEATKARRDKARHAALARWNKKKSA